MDVGELLERLAARLLRDFGRSVQIHAEAGLPSVLAVAGEMEAALLELVGNALHATPEGGSVAIVAEAVGAGERVRVTVADTGSGMEPALLKRCVEPFVTTKPERCGTGLGLSVAYAFAVASHGALHLESRPGKGTQASLELPGSLDMTADVPDVVPFAAPSGHVLLVEDDPAGRVGIARLLRSLGYAVTEAASAADALEVLRGEMVPSILLSDVILPGGQDGASLVADVRRLRAALPALLMSGYAARGPGEAGWTGGIRLIPKPLRKLELKAALRLELGTGQIVR